MKIKRLVQILMLMPDDAEVFIGGYSTPLEYVRIGKIGKLFCGKCGGAMIGVSGTSKTGVIHAYYVCGTKRRQRSCDKKDVKKDWIETLVLNKAKEIVFDDDMIEFISENTYQYYIRENTDSSYTDSLERNLKDVDKSLGNLLKAVEAGIFNDTTKQRMDELEAQKKQILGSIAQSKLKTGLNLTKDHIRYFLLRYRDMDFGDIECQKKIISTFINSVFVYDDEITITFNCSGDNRTVTLKEVDSAKAKEFDSCPLSSTTTRTGELFFILRNVFAFTQKIERR